MSIKTGLNRRKIIERRCIDAGPPKYCFERRKRAERRLPTVEEDAVSEAEWFRCMAASIVKRRAERLAQLEALLGVDSSQPAE